MAESLVYQSSVFDEGSFSVVRKRGNKMARGRMLIVVVGEGGCHTVVATSGSTAATTWPDRPAVSLYD